MKKIIFMMALLAGCCFWAEEAVGQSTTAKQKVKVVQTKVIPAGYVQAKKEFKAQHPNATREQKITFLKEQGMYVEPKKN